MRTHKLKLDIAFCDAVLSGEKSFEIRKNDRGYQKGDHIKFVPVERGEYIMYPCEHDISKKEYEITYVLSNLGIEEGYVVLAIKEVK